MALGNAPKWKSPTPTASIMPTTVCFHPPIIIYKPTTASLNVLSQSKHLLLHPPSRSHIQCNTPTPKSNPTPPEQPINRPGVPPFAASSQPISQSQVDQWLRDVESEDPTRRLRAVLACKDLTPQQAAPILTRLFDAGESLAQNRAFAALFLGYKPNGRSFDILSALIHAPLEADEVRANAVAALGYLRDSRAVPLCLSLLRGENTHWTTRVAAVVTLGMIVEQNREIAPLVYDDLVVALRAADPSDYSFLISCIGALGEVGDVRCVSQVVKYVNAEEFSLAQCACEALGRLPCQLSFQTLQELVNRRDAHVNVLWAAELALQKVSHELTKEH